MAEEAAISFLLDNVKQLLAEQYHLIKGATDEVKLLQGDLEILRAFIEDATAKRNKDQTLKVLMRQVREVIFEAEDAIDTFVIQAAEKKTQSFFARMTNGSIKTLNVANEVKSVRDKIDVFFTKHRVDRTTFGTERVADTSKEERKEPFVRKENIVGLEDETETLFGYLMEEKKELDVISIIGLPGLGKTTIAGKIFRDPKVQYEFPTRIWAFVSQEYKRKDVFLSILKSFTTITDDMHRKTDTDIAQILGDYLREGRYLIVLDDVWTAEAWLDLQLAFPKTNKLGKILITSRHEEVARRANSNREPHKLRFLTHQESWLLFTLEVFGDRSCPSKLEVHGKLIVDQCDRLPLAIVVIAGILVKKTAAGDMNATEKQWAKVRERVKYYLKEDPEKRMEKIISLSYNKLPHHLRPCFLYFGMFPEDFEIPVQKLILVWIAEGFIQKKNEISLEETAQDYLEELISRNLIMGEKKSLDGRIKSCRIHDMLREFCKNEAGNENEKLFQEIKMSDEGSFTPSIPEVQNCRRLNIHSHFLNFISSKPFGLRVRTLFSKEEITLPLKNISSIPAAFILLRVLDVKSVKFTKFPNDLTNLVHLRYIALSSDFKVLPKSITKIWNLQTLIVDTTSRTLELNADLWNMINLRHFKTNASAILPKPPEVTKQGGSEELQTLGMVSTQNCTEDVFGRACNLKKLGIRGQISALARSRGLEKLRNLRKLKLFNDVRLGSTSEGPVPRLPPPDAFPPKLKSLTLSATNLEWDQMSTLCMLNYLEVLKLKDKAFVGVFWNASGAFFRSLDVLYIERTELVHWKASSQNFPVLGSLVLRNCEKLQDIPLDLHKSLHSLELKRCKFAVDSAKEIERAKKHDQAQENSEITSGFKLHIAPGDE
ncbi:putative disease resistance RPP13-like protein 3 isoform X2 [Henckelia pumila]|uniref:putative disease resistance RPP13-like protein 3 isoform X2 n=1 Tax=Henckelia pumila TaxID=405737 RepID=UPI003C6E7D08